MIIIRVKLIYMVWDVVSISKLPFCNLPPHTLQRKGFSQPSGSVKESRADFSPAPALTQSVLSTPLARMLCVRSSPQVPPVDDTPTIQNASNHKPCANRAYSKASLTAALQNTSESPSIVATLHGVTVGPGWLPGLNDKLLICVDGFRGVGCVPFSSVASLLNHESKSCKALRLHRKTSDKAVNYIVHPGYSPFRVLFCGYLPIGWRLLP